MRETEMNLQDIKKLKPISQEELEQISEGILALARGEDMSEKREYAEKHLAEHLKEAEMSEVISWRELEPEERDQLLHEKVMDYKECTGKFVRTEEMIEGGSEPDVYKWVCDVCNAYLWKIKLTGHPSFPHDSRYDGVPAYSTSMDAAWLVVMHIKDMKPYPQVKFQEHIARLLQDHWETIELWDITPEIICIAALKVVGIEVVV